MQIDLLMTARLALLVLGLVHMWIAGKSLYSQWICTEDDPVFWEQFLRFLCGFFAFASALCPSIQGMFLSAAIGQAFAVWATAKRQRQLLRHPKVCPVPPPRTKPHVARR